jgi:hypothetical protein
VRNWKNTTLSIARESALSIGLIAMLFLGQAAHAERLYPSTITTATTTIEYDPAGDDESLTYVDEADQTPKGSLGHFGPFYVTDAKTVTMVGEVDHNTPAQFKRLLTSYPGVKTLKLVECPGTEDDEANLALARMVRTAGLDTRVPAKGSVRSGGVELFLAGVHRTAEPGAEFGVHSWQDEEGREAKDYPPDAPEHREYLAFYQDMGMAPDAAKAFYAFTNAQPFSNIHYMTPVELERFHLTN